MTRPEESINATESVVFVRKRGVNSPGFFALKFDCNGTAQYQFLNLRCRVQQYAAEYFPAARRLYARLRVSEKVPSGSFGRMAL